MMSGVTAEQRPPLPVVSPYLHNCLFERPCGQRVKDGVEGAVDGQNKYDDPGADGPCRERRERVKMKKKTELVNKMFKD